MPGKGGDLSCLEVQLLEVDNNIEREMEDKERFIIRVYGIAIHNDHLLVGDEIWHDTYMTKFPGGGLEYGEGTIECLKRECMEEFGQEVEVLSHFYTTDFFQPTLFLNDKQLISIYYKMAVPSPELIAMSNTRTQFSQRENGSMAFRWMALDQFKADDLSLPIDRIVAERLFGL